MLQRERYTHSAKSNCSTCSTAQGSTQICQSCCAPGLGAAQSTCLVMTIADSFLLSVPATDWTPRRLEFPSAEATKGDASANSIRDFQPNPLRCIDCTPIMVSGPPLLAPCRNANWRSPRKELRCHRALLMLFFPNRQERNLNLPDACSSPLLRSDTPMHLLSSVCERARGATPALANMPHQDSRTENHMGKTTGCLTTLTDQAGRG